MTTYDLIHNYKIIIDTQHSLCNDNSRAVQAAWDMCMNMGRQHGFTDRYCVDGWCKAVRDREHKTKNIRGVDQYEQR